MYNNNFITLHLVLMTGWSTRGRSVGKGLDQDGGSKQKQSMALWKCKVHC